MDEHQFVEVYRAKNSLQAVLLQQALAEAGIRATVENDHLQFGDLMEDWTTGPRITVENKDVAKGVEVLARWEQADSNAHAASVEASEVANCLACGARMPIEESECPACGWSFEDSDLGNGDPNRA